MKKKMTKLQKHNARNNIKKLITLLTHSEKKRMNKERKRKRVPNKSYRWEPRPGVKEWILSQPNLKNKKLMEKMGLIWI